MSSIIIKKVKSKRDLGRFIDFHYDLYEGCEQDVPNLFSDEMKTLDKERNAAFEFCEAEYFMAFYKDGGRMAGPAAWPPSSTTRPTSGGAASACASAGSTSLTTST